MSFVHIGENISFRIRKILFRSLLRQDIAWFDKQVSGKIITRLTEDIEAVKDGIGEKFVSIIRGFAGAIMALGISLFKCVILVGIILVVLFIVLIPIIFLGKFAFFIILFTTLYSGVLQRKQ